MMLLPFETMMDALRENIAAKDLLKSYLADQDPEWTLSLTIAYKLPCRRQHHCPPNIFLDS